MLLFDDHRDAERAGRFVRPLCFADQGNEFYGLRTIELTHPDGPLERNLIIGYQGSCSLINYRDRYFALFTRHQIASVGEETRDQFAARMSLIYVLMDDGRDSTNLPISAILSPGVLSHDPDCMDFVIALVERSMITPFMIDQFFPVDERYFGSVGSFALAAGFPSADQKILMEIGGLHTPIACKSGRIQRREVGATGTMNYPVDELPMDGFSGGAVITVGRNANDDAASQFISHFNGLIQRAGNGFVHFLTTERITLEIDLAIAAGRI